MAWHICFYILCSTGYDGYDCHKIEVTQLLCAAQSVSKAGEFTIPVENPTIFPSGFVCETKRCHPKFGLKKGRVPQRKVHKKC